MIWRSAFQAAAALAAMLVPLAASAHSASTAYLRVTAASDGGYEMQWRVALRDLDALVDLDRNGDGRLTWDEVDDRRADLENLMRSAIIVVDSGPSCRLAQPALQYLALGGTGYAQLTTHLACGAASATVEYQMFAGIDPSHRLLAITDQSPTPAIVAPGERWRLPARADIESPQLTRFIVDGFGHILGGLDHLLFLVGLMLPAVVRRSADGTWRARDDLRSALLAVAGIATAFTVAHSLTLAAATFGWLRIPAAIIEPLIAATVLATALNNIYPVVIRRLWIVAFAFGLVHGFGFAEVLIPLDLAPRALALALFGFNLGVELGQLVVVTAAFVALALVRHSSGYVRYALRGGSAALALIAVVWIVERLGIVSPLTS